MVKIIIKKWLTKSHVDYAILEIILEINSYQNVLLNNFQTMHNLNISKSNLDMNICCF